MLEDDSIDLPTDLDASLEKQLQEFNAWQEMINTTGPEDSEYDELFKALKRAQAKEDMLQCIISLVNKEFNGVTEEDALDSWYAFKQKHSLGR